MLEFVGDILRGAAELVKAGGAGALAFVAMGTLVIGYIVLKLFPKDHVGVRIAVFSALVLIIGVFGYLALDAEAKRASSSSVVENAEISDQGEGDLQAGVPPSLLDPPKRIADVTSPPAPKSCNPGPYIVFFNPSDAAISDVSAQIIDGAVQAYRGCGDSLVKLTATDAGEGSEEYVARRLPRLQNMVKSYLIGAGIPEGRIGFDTRVGPLVRSVAGIRDSQNQNVTITFAPAGRE
jgi:OmpA-OmpF porin, OOP family